MLLRVTQITLVLFLMCGSALAHDPAVEKDKWWWDDSWWTQGRIPVAKNYAVRTQWVTYKSGEHEIRAFVARPKKSGKFPGVLFAHGRRGLDELIQKKVKRLAARGLVILAPAVYESRFLDPLPYAHDYSLEQDFNRGVDALLQRKDISSKKICLSSHTRGGYYTLKTAVTLKRQIKDVACYVSWYPHMQDPNAPEPAQIYGYAPEADDLKIPVLIFVGDREQYQRRRSIESAVKQMKADVVEKVEKTTILEKSLAKIDEKHSKLLEDLKMLNNKVFIADTITRKQDQTLLRQKNKYDKLKLDFDALSKQCKGFKKKENDFINLAKQMIKTEGKNQTLLRKVKELKIDNKKLANFAKQAEVDVITAQNKYKKSLTQLADIEKENLRLKVQYSKSNMSLDEKTDRKSTRLNSSHTDISRMPSSA